MLVKGEAEALELVALLLVQHGADVAPGTARLRLGVYPDGAEARLELEIEADGLAPEGANEFLDAGRCDDALARNQLAALAELAQRHGGRCDARRAGPCHLVASVVLPVLGG